MKEIDAPIQLVEGLLSCPRCQGLLQRVEFEEDVPLTIIIIAFVCENCEGAFGLRFIFCPTGHANIDWIDLVNNETDEKLN